MRAHHDRRRHAGRLRQRDPAGARGVGRRRHASPSTPGTIRTGDNRRFAGEDLMAGSAALGKGKMIRPADLGLLASLGIAEVPVQRRLRVAFFSTGDELRSIGEPLDAGCVYDSNRYTLFGMLHAPWLRHHRHGHRARRPGGAGRGAAQRLRKRGRDHHLGRRVGRRGRLHASRSWRALATSRSGRSACARGARWPSAASIRTATAPSCLACPAIRWR